LVRHKVGFVFCHGYYMPPAPALFREHFESGPARPLVQAPETDSPLPASPAVIRLLGPDRKGIEERTGKQWNQVVAPKDGELPEIASMALSILEQNVDVIINVNNHYEGSAPLTIGKLERMIDERNRRA
jgi:hypothetical protein